MFATACALAHQFTFPVVISQRRWSGETAAGVGAFVVLNEDGWIVTAAHIFETLVKAEADRKEIDAMETEIAAVEKEPGHQPKYIANRVKKLRARANRDWVTNHSYWWARDGLRAEDITVVAEADIAIARLEPYPRDMAVRYPVLKDPGVNFQAGTSLCRLGFPFGQVKATYDAPSDFFKVEGEMSFFPLDGIFTRRLRRGRSADGKFTIDFIETSSPGLVGQSGGPIFDVHGRIWGIQSRTQHIPLGFNPPAPSDSSLRGTVPQFINLGVGVHVATVREVLDHLNVRYDISPD